MAVIEEEKSKEPTVADLELEAKAQEIGYLGKIFGDKDHARMYLVALFLFMVYAILTAFAFIDEGLRPTLVDGILGLTISVLSFLAGKRFGNGNGNGL